MILQSIAILVATWFAVGRVPRAPGTAGSIAALALAWAMIEYGGFGQVHLLVAVAVAIPVAIWAARLTADAVGKKDPSIVVVDEVLGTWLALAGAVRFNWKSCLAALLLFRLFDIWKPWPVRRLESLPGGTGIVADDLMAGLYAALVLFLAGCFNLY